MRVMSQGELKKNILEQVKDFGRLAVAPVAFKPGETYIPVSGKMLDEEDFSRLVEACLDGWLTSGRFTIDFEKQLAAYLGVRYAALVNSGSSANLLAVSALTSHQLGERALKPGDEVITLAAGFPTTVNPIVQNNLVPVFVDVDLETQNVCLRSLEQALSPKTRAIILPHTLGNPFNLAAVKEITQQRKLWLIEDNCDALGALYAGQKTGSFGDIATFSFYPAHHITTGEGGAVATNDAVLNKLILSFRDWGRDCWCDTGKDNTCGKRFKWQQGGLPLGYDHKYIYAHIGYNLKATDLQAAIGLSQLQKLPGFVERRRRNWQALRAGLASLEGRIVFTRPDPQSVPSWFGFVMVMNDPKLSRAGLVEHLESKKIGTRMIFGGNLIHQPAYQHVQYRTVDTLKNSSRIMTDACWIGVYPGITDAMIDYTVATIKSFVGNPS